MGCLVFHTSTHIRGFWIDQWHSLTLHVGTHEGTVGVIVFQERNTCCRNGNYLFWRYVHVVDLIRWEFLVVTTVTSHNDWLSKATFFVQLRVGLSDDVLIFFIGCQPNDFVGHYTFFTVHFTVWCLDETIFVQMSIR